jgi:hypothetical protein
VAVVRRAVRFLSTRVAQIDAPEVCTSDLLDPGIAAMSFPGRLYFPTHKNAAWSRRPSKWYAQDIETVLHEVLHGYGWRSDLNTDESLHWIEEGTVEAVAQDLNPALVRLVSLRRERALTTYLPWVTRIRKASIAATGTPWRSSAARSWRISLLLTPPDLRGEYVVPS